jgi:hypothetical protein
MHDNDFLSMKLRMTCNEVGFRQCYILPMATYTELEPEYVNDIENRMAAVTGEKAEYSQPLG